ncbi:MAG: mKIAA0772 protein [Olpidium bornovanus]|uniref:MKIAA0772 protein n=1 Tax=Olpidium bornovanus TaxID=278681 RepID=A0A8H7ZNB9_9FUNG|nr:MAG: mKIAA0772 protein [Olpidium bornovanus]
MHLVLKSSSDHYTWTLPTTWLRNLIGGNKYLEHQGDARIVNHTTGDMCVLQFKESGFFSNAKNEVEGTITVGESRKTMGLTGKWSEVLYHEVEPSQLTILWKARSLLPDADQYYGFTAFTIELNEITADLRGRLPRTDSRLRPDLRLYENGYVDSAEEEKKRVEERQRETRRAMEARGEAWRPAWFELRDDAVDGNPAWVYKGGYWEARQTQQWPDGVELW